MVNLEELPQQEGQNRSILMLIIDTVIMLECFWLYGRS